MFKRSILTMLIISGLVCPVVYATSPGGVNNVAEETSKVVNETVTNADSSVVSGTLASINEWFGSSCLPFLKGIVNPSDYAAAFKAVKEAGWRNACQEAFTNHKPALTGILAAVTLIGGGSWYLYNKFLKTSKAE